MKKRIKLLLCFAGLLVLSLGLAACEDNTVIDDYLAQGYKITVTYEANGGRFLEREGISVKDMFNPSLYEKDDEGNIRIKLMEPTGKDRVQSGSSAITLTRGEHFFSGWYQSFEIITNEAGNAVDYEGRELEKLENSSYVYKGTKDPATPAYEYFDHWDFENDFLEYSEEDELLSMTLCRLGSILRVPLLLSRGTRRRVDAFRQEQL